MSSVQSLTSNRTDLLKISSAGNPDTYELTALAHDPSGAHPVLKATVSGKTFAEDFYIYPARLILSRSSISIPAKSSASVSVTAYDHENRQMSSWNWTSSPVWTSSNTAVATVRSTSADAADVFGVANGNATLSVKLFGGSASASVEVATPLPVASVVIDPSPLLLGIDYFSTSRLSYQIHARAYDVNGNLLSGRVATFSSDDPHILHVTSSGLVTPVIKGRTIVRAVVEGVHAQTWADVTCFNCPGSWVID